MDEQRELGGGALVSAAVREASRDTRGLTRCRSVRQRTRVGRGVSKTLSQADIEHIREGYRLFTRGDPAFLERYEPDATMVFPESLPKGGTYASPLEALDFWNTAGELFEDAHPDPRSSSVW